MKVGDADSPPIQPSNLQQIEKFFGSGNLRMRQKGQVIQYFISVGEGAKSQFHANERVGDDLIVQEQFLEFRFRLSKMVDPDRGINENHFFPCAAGQPQLWDRYLREPPVCGQPRSGQAG